MNIADIDPNFKVETQIKKEGLRFIDVRLEPFKIYGIYYEGEKFRRLPEEVAERTSPGVHKLHANTAGGRVRFMTDSPYIAINASMDGLGKMSHFAFTGSIGFDLYADGAFVKSFVPSTNIVDGYEGLVELGEKKMRDITINFPLYSNVKRLFVGVDECATLTRAPGYINELPVVYYGSSITQGGCASRPGMSYQSIVSRKFNLDYINLGFSGNARGEDAIIDYIASLEMSMFVFDYDHNAPSPDHLRRTHEIAFKKIRATHPDIPIILMSRPKQRLTEQEKERVEIIRATYLNAKASGDDNVYMITGAELMALSGDEGTVDSTHPTDYGFASMAKSLCELIEANKLHLKLK